MARPKLSLWNSGPYTFSSSIDATADARLLSLALRRARSLYMRGVAVIYSLLREVMNSLL